MDGFALRIDHDAFSIKGCQGDGALDLQILVSPLSSHTLRINFHVLISVHSLMLVLESDAMQYLMH